MSARETVRPGAKARMQHSPTPSFLHACLPINTLIDAYTYLSIFVAADAANLAKGALSNHFQDVVVFLGGGHVPTKEGREDKGDEENGLCGLRAVKCVFVERRGAARRRRKRRSARRSIVGGKHDDDEVASGRRKSGRRTWT